MNGPKHESNRRAIEHYAQVEVLAEVEPMAVITPTTLMAAFQKYFLNKEGIEYLSAVVPDRTNSQMQNTLVKQK